MFEKLISIKSYTVTAFSSGFQSYKSKPVNPSDLLNMLVIRIIESHSMEIDPSAQFVNMSHLY